MSAGGSAPHKHSVCKKEESPSAAVSPGAVIEKGREEQEDLLGSTQLTQVCESLRFSE